MAGINVPAFGFLSARHDTDWIAGIMGMFMKHVRELCGGRTVKQRYIVTDFSYTLICASLMAFNRESLLCYLLICYDVPQGKCRLKDIKSHTFVCLCAAHIMKALSNRVNRVETDRTCKKTVLTYFACLQRCLTLSEAIHTNKYAWYCAVHTIHRQLLLLATS